MIKLETNFKERNKWT